LTHFIKLTIFFLKVGGDIMQNIQKDIYSTPLPVRLQRVGEILSFYFVGKSEIIRLILISAVAGEHLVLIGPPGTAKSAILRLFAKLISANYFEYLLTRFTEPNELFGPVDIQAFRQGVYRRKTEGMLPNSEIVFLDEIFKANSAILNSLLTLLNERSFNNGNQVIKTPIISVFGASNEVPDDEALLALFDRFLLRVKCDNLDSYYFNELLLHGIRHEKLKIKGEDSEISPIISIDEIRQLHRNYDKLMNFSEDFINQYKSLVFQIRSEGISFSDRRVIKMLRLFCASAYIDGRQSPNPSDFFILKHIWNSIEQIPILEGIVDPVIEEYYQAHPEERRLRGIEVGVGALIKEVNMIREIIERKRSRLGDVELFSYLRNLNEIKRTLEQIQTEEAKSALNQVELLLDQIFNQFTQ